MTAEITPPSPYVQLLPVRKEHARTDADSSDLSRRDFIVDCTWIWHSTTRWLATLYAYKPTGNKAIVDGGFRPRHFLSYHWAKFGCNLGCYACRALSPLRNVNEMTRHTAVVKTRCHSQNRKYIAYRNVVRGRPTHGHMQHAKKFGEVRLCELCEHRERDRHSLG